MSVMGGSSDMLDRDVERTLAKVRRTVDTSRELVTQVERRVAETDALLARFGLTRQQVLDLKLSETERRKVNEELRKLGLPSVEEQEREVEDIRFELRGTKLGHDDVGDTANRDRKFRRMKYRIG